MHNPTPTSAVVPYMLAAVVLTFGATSAWSVLHSGMSEAPAPREVSLLAAQGSAHATAPVQVVQPPAQTAADPELAQATLPASPVRASAPPIEPAPAPAPSRQKPAEAPAPIPSPKQEPASAKSAEKPVTRPAPPKHAPAVPVGSAQKSKLAQSTTLGLPPAIPVPASPTLTPTAPPAPPVPVVDHAAPPVQTPGPSISIAPAKSGGSAEGPKLASAASGARTKPQVVAATADRAWVKIDAQKTVIVVVGETVPGLGTYRGKSSDGPRFD